MAALPFFAGLPEDELDAVASCASECEFAPGDALTSEGDFGHAVSHVRAFASFKRDVWELERRAPEAAGRLRVALDQRLTR